LLSSLPWNPDPSLVPTKFLQLSLNLCYVF
jgi:hypothetical protein